VKVVILCGGKGTRLREETEFRPKPMVPIGGRPILWHIMRIYAAHGHTEFVLCLGYKGDVIKEWFRNLAWMVSDVRLKLGSDHTPPHFFSDLEESGWTVTLADTGLDTMTGARIRRIEKYLGEDQEFLLTYGDGVGNVDITASIAQHRGSGRALTVTGVRPPGRWGELRVVDGAVSTFLEKPQTSGGRINGGFFVANRRIFDYLNDDPSLIFEQGPLTALSRDGQLGCYLHDGFWQPMDTYQEFVLLNRMWDEGRAEWKIW
jgi:glucose-1-phosphate cytidylyltransferase